MDKYEFKLRHAEANFRDMCNSVDQREEFERHFCNFLSSSRTIVQYAVKDAILQGKKKAIFELLNAFDYIEIFKNIRDEDIHQQPIIPAAHHSVMICDFVEATDAVWEPEHANWLEPDFDPDPPYTKISEQVTHLVEYQLNEGDLSRFKLSNDLSLIGHCSAYLEILKRVLATAKDQGLISP